MPKNAALGGEKPAKQANLSTKIKPGLYQPYRPGLAGWMFFRRSVAGAACGSSANFSHAHSCGMRYGFGRSRQPKPTQI